MRSGVVVKAPAGDFVIDAGPELRLQLLQQNVAMVNAAIFTHAHADHIMGLDDLRIFGFRREKQQIEAARATSLAAGQPFDDETFRKTLNSNIPLFCESEVEETIRRVFFYAFSDPATHSHRFAAPRLSFERIKPGQEFSLLGLKILPVRLMHGQLPTLGYRIGNVAFCTDVSSIPQESRDLLQGLDTLIIDALRYDPHPTHLSVSQAVKWGEKLNARRTILTHMAHDLDYNVLANELPEGFEPAYDGLKIELSGL